MGIFSRLFKIGQSEVHSIVDSMEDPIKLTEQGIRDLKSDLQDALKSLASVKALSIKLAKDAEDQKNLATSNERKALLLLQKGESGGLEPPEAERLAREALTLKEQATNRAAELKKQADGQKATSEKLQSKVNELKTSISSYENELISLKARSKTANATRKINQQLANLDSGGTVAMLEKMKEKVTEQEALSEAYGDMADSSASIDDEISKALESGTSPGVEDSLAKMKAKLAAAKES